MPGHCLRAILVGAMLSLCLGFPAQAASPDPGLRKAGTAVAIALPVAAIGVSLLHHRDWHGLGQFAVSTGLTVGSALILRQIVREQRPDFSDFRSFTPETVAIADSSADYMWARYGWRYGIPAYLASTFVGYTLTDTKKNHWYDVTATGALAFAFNYAIVTRYHASNRYSLRADAEPSGIHLRFAMNF